MQPPPHILVPVIAAIAAAASANPDGEETVYLTSGDKPTVADFYRLKSHSDKG